MTIDTPDTALAIQSKRRRKARPVHDEYVQFRMPSECYEALEKEAQAKEYKSVNLLIRELAMLYADGKLVSKDRQAAMQLLADNMTGLIANFGKLEQQFESTGKSIDGSIREVKGSVNRGTEDLFTKLNAVEKVVRHLDSNLDQLADDLYTKIANLDRKVRNIHAFASAICIAGISEECRHTKESVPDAIRRYEDKAWEIFGSRHQLDPDFDVTKGHRADDVNEEPRS